MDRRRKEAKALMVVGLMLCHQLGINPLFFNPPPLLVMTGHKKQRGWRGLEEYGEIERVRPQHLPRVTTSTQGVLTTAILAVHCSACLTSTHRAGPRRTAAEDTFKYKERREQGKCKPLFLCLFLCLCRLLLFFLSFNPSDYFSRHFCCAELKAAKWERQFSARFSSLPGTVF